MPQHLQMTRKLLKGLQQWRQFLANSLHTTLRRQPPSVYRLHDLQLRKTKNSLDALQCLCFLGGIIKQIPNAGHGSKKHSYLLH